MMRDDKDLYDSNLLFNNRLRRIRYRIQTLRNDYQNVNHYFSKAIIETELERLEDDLFERSFVLQKSKENKESEKTTD
ncbi:MAG: hypothetical protein IKF82_00685 [Bacilli bacterium]|nr:hypothetical protein [Bacilli bacterium]